MNRIVFWIKNHKLVCLLFIIILFLLGKKSLPVSQTYQGSDLYGGVNLSTLSKNSTLPVAGGSSSRADISMPVSESAPNANVGDRMVIKSSYLSLQVTKVNVVQKQILQKTEELGGYMVNSLISNPEDVAQATVVVRIPEKKLEKALEYYQSLSIKVISENLQGYDVTDQYTDFEKQLKTYEKTKTIFEGMLDKAINVQDILQIQREIINVQASIDAIVGQQDYLKKNAEMAKVTLYLSTDELVLPYSPTNTWRPGVIFKQAVRSLLGTLRGFGSLVIWIIVYSIIFVPLFFIIYFIKKRRQIKNSDFK